jgi:hypothetical protein
MFGQCGNFHLVFTLNEVEYTQENYNTATGRKFSTSETYVRWKYHKILS